MTFSKETLLIVDDSLLQRTILRDLFQEHFCLLEAASGGECMRMIQENASNIDLVLLDLVMPGIDGFEVLRRRQTMPEFQDIPVVVLTTSDDPDVQVNALELGANDYVVKPIEEKTAFARIQNLLKSKHRVKTLTQKYVEFKIKSELDGMTGLFNKTTSLEIITDALAHFPMQSHALLIVDIDNFKAINDVYGHTVGDHTISVISNVITSQFSGADVIGRIGGDEFIIFIQNVTEKESVYQKTQDLVQIISGKENLSIPQNVTISIGLAFSEGHQQDYTILFSQADEALYSSKHAGKSCYHEYGKHPVLADSAPLHTILVKSSSRNVMSMLEFAYESQIRIHTVSSLKEIEHFIQKKEQETSCIYLDISSETDNGKEMLRSLLTFFTDKIPLVIICQEGNMEQIRYAAECPFTMDILFAPLETATLTRRIIAHRILTKS